MKIRALIVTGVLLIVALPLFAPIYMKMDGITGESKAAGHEGWIELLSFSWGVSQPSTGGGGAGKTAVHDISVVKRQDKSSPVLMQAAMTGKHFQHVVIDDNGQRFQLQDVYVRGVQTVGGSNNETPRESLSLNFTKDVTHESPMGGNVANKKYDKVYFNNALVNFGGGAPAAMGVQSVHIVPGGNRAIIVVCDVAGSQGAGGFTRAHLSKQLLGNLTIALSQGGGTTQQKADSSPAYKENVPYMTFTFQNVYVTGAQVNGDGCTSFSLSFKGFTGPVAGFDYIK